MLMPPMGPGGMMAPPPMMAPPGAMPPHMAGGRTFGPRGTVPVPIVSTSRPGPTTLPVVILAGPCKTFTSLPKMQGGVHQAACISYLLDAVVALFKGRASAPAHMLLEHPADTP